MDIGLSYARGIHQMDPEDLGGCDFPWTYFKNGDRITGHFRNLTTKPHEDTLRVAVQAYSIRPRRNLALASVLLQTK